MATEPKKDSKKKDDKKKTTVKKDSKKKDTKKKIEPKKKNPVEKKTTAKKSPNMEKENTLSKFASHPFVPPSFNDVNGEGAFERIKMRGIKPAPLPIVICIKNLTDEKLKGVKLIDFDHKENDKINYKLDNGNVTYDEFLRSLLAQNQDKADVIGFIVQHVYGKHFVGKQSNVSVVFEYKEVNGRIVTIPNRFMMDAYQQQSMITTMKNINHPLTYNSNMILDYLMPEQEIVLRLYFHEKINQK